MAHEGNAVQRPTVRPRTPIWLINRFQDQDPSDPEDDEEEIGDMATSNPAPRSYFALCPPHYIDIFRKVTIAFQLEKYLI